MGNCCRRKRTRVDETAYHPKSRGNSTSKPSVAEKQERYQSAVSLCHDVPIVPSGGNSAAWPTDTNGKPEESLQLETLQLNTPLTYTDGKEFVHSERGSIPQLNTPITNTEEDTSVYSDGACSHQLNSPVSYSDEEGSKLETSQLSTTVTYSFEDVSVQSDGATSSELNSFEIFSDEEVTFPLLTLQRKRQVTFSNEDPSVQPDSSSSSQLNSPVSYSEEEDSFQVETSQLSTTVTYSFEDKSDQCDGARSSELNSSAIFSDGEVTFPLLTLQRKRRVTFSNEDPSVQPDSSSSSQPNSPISYSDEEEFLPLGTLQLKPRVTFSNEDTSVQPDTSSSSQPNSPVSYSDEEEFTSELEEFTQPSKRKMDDRGAFSQSSSPSVKPTFKKLKPYESPICSMNPCVGPYNLHSLRRDLQYVMEYGNENYAYKRSVELYFLPDNCLSCTELDEEDRRKMVRSLIKSHSKHSLSLESLCLAINYLDRLLLNLRVERCTYNIMAITSMVLALKTSERDSNELHQLILRFRSHYTNTTMWTMEALIMRKLRYRLIAPTTNFFLEHLIMKRMASAELTAQTVEENHILMGYAKAIVKLCLTEYYYCFVPPSLQAICCVKAAAWVVCPDKTVTIPGVQGYPEEAVQEVLEYTITLIKDNYDYFSSLTDFEDTFYLYHY